MKFDFPVELYKSFSFDWNKSLFYEKEDISLNIICFYS